jgi:hypothetical protein
MGERLSMSARREITKKHAADYGSASKKAKGVMLDQLVATTGWSRAKARRALTAAGKRKGPVRALKPTRDGGKLVGLSGTKPGPLLRKSIQVRKAGDEHERAPGFVEADLVLHCGASSSTTR